MNGAEAMIRTAVAAGVEVCFTNPGTTEMHLVAALDAVPGMRAVLGLFEGVCTGAADGYGRMADRPALTLLHLGPGLGNGWANLHNARRARAPLVNLIGDHATWHVANDPPLASDIEALALAVSSWVRTARTARDLAADGAEAIAAAHRTPGRIATLVVPADCAWGEADGPATPRTPEDPPRVNEDAVEEAAAALRAEGPAVLLLGGHALREAGLRRAARIAAGSGCRLLAETFVARLERGAGLPTVERLSYFPEQIAEQLAPTASLVLAGTNEPVSFFGYPGAPGRPVPASCRVVPLAGPEEDVGGALEALAARIGAPRAGIAADSGRPELPSGPLHPATLGAVVAALQPKGSIIIDEAATSGLPWFLHSAGCPPHTVLGLTGGSIGQGIPCATGAALACPDRPVLSLQADGSGMYTLQGLWTQAREGLDVTTIVCANRSYRILRVELARAGIAEPGPQAQALTDLTRPTLDWVKMSRGLGVPACRVETADALATELGRALAEPGPHLIEAVV